MRSRVGLARVSHARRHPLRHRFAYRTTALLLDLDELPLLAQRCRLFGHNGTALFALHDADHGARDGTPLRPWVAATLHRRGFVFALAGVRLLTMPRLLGYAFNPLSVYLCDDRDGALRAVIYEVRNTFGGAHHYALPATPAHGCTKTFYVSPFVAPAAGYSFRLRVDERRVALAIVVGAAGMTELLATWRVDLLPFDDARLLRAWLRAPLVTFKATAAIRWQALRLWLRGAPTYPRRVRAISGHEGSAIASQPSRGPRPPV